MKIELDVCSSARQMRRITEALMHLLEDECVCIEDVETGTPSSDADVHLVCFDIRKHACPFPVIEWIEQLEGKRIMLICTSALGGISGYQKRIESQLLPFLPDECTYLGMHLCPAAMYEEEVAYLERQMAQSGEAAGMVKLKGMAQASFAHPDEQDLRNVQHFVFERLECI